MDAALAFCSHSRSLPSTTHLKVETNARRDGTDGAPSKEATTPERRTAAAAATAAAMAAAAAVAGDVAGIKRAASLSS